MMAPGWDKRHIFPTSPFRGEQISCILDADSRAARGFLCRRYTPHGRVGLQRRVFLRNTSEWKMTM